ncbi:MAG: hypothetical protein GX868_09685 [Actinobacteria bacterium]|nr:hypothetical protein [Actinomycetota bacterium]
MPTIASANDPATSRRLTAAVLAIVALSVAGTVVVRLNGADSDAAERAVAAETSDEPGAQTSVETSADPGSVPGEDNQVAGETTTTATPLDAAGPTSPKLTITTMRHDELTFNWSPSVDLPIPGGVGVAGYEVHVDGEIAGLYDADTTGAVVMTTVRTDGEPHFIQVIPIDRNGTRGVPGWAKVRRGPELGVTTG